MGLDELNDIRRLVRMGVDIAESVENASHNANTASSANKAHSLNNESRQVETEAKAYASGFEAASANSGEAFELKEMTCPNCGATMRADELAHSTGALGSVNCPYCGSQIVINDEVKNAQYVHKVDVEKKRADIEERRQKLEEEKYKNEQEHQKTQETIDTIKSIDNGLNTALKVGGAVLGCGIFLIAIIVLIIIFVVLKATGVI